MTSTERRHKRNRDLMKQWRGWGSGLRVTVKRANGKTLKTVTTSEAWLTRDGGAYVQVEGIPGNTALHRVEMGWNP